MRIIYTLGHSHHPITWVLTPLAQHDIDLVADVRSHPRSRFAPQFNQAGFRAELQARGIDYLHLPELGGRAATSVSTAPGATGWERLAQQPPFLAGLTRLRQEATQHRIALVCAEFDPLMCHRSLLVGARLQDDTTQIIHILRDGALESHAQLEDRLLLRHRLHAEEYLRSREERLCAAYQRQELRLTRHRAAPRPL